MRRLILFAVLLSFVFLGTSHAQQTSNAASGAPRPSAVQPAATPVPMTPEMYADLLMARRQYLDAVHAYQHILESDPKNAAVLNEAGIACEQLGDLHCAERYYKKAMHADKTFASPINNLGTVEFDKSHYSHAIRYYQHALLLDKDMATIYSNLGYAYFDNKKYDEAMASFDKALQYDPGIFANRGEGGSILQERSITDPGLFYLYVAKAYAQMGDAEHAAEYLKMARDDGYKNFQAERKDPAFARVIKDPRVLDVFTVLPAYASEPQKGPAN